MTRYTYTLITPRRTMQCRDLNAAEYMYSCRKSASLWRHDRFTGVDSLVMSKTDGIESMNINK